MNRTALWDLLETIRPRIIESGMKVAEEDGARLVRLIGEVLCADDDDVANKSRLEAIAVLNRELDELAYKSPLERVVAAINATEFYSAKLGRSGDRRVFVKYDGKDAGFFDPCWDGRSNIGCHITKRKGSFAEIVRKALEAK